MRWLTLRNPRRSFLSAHASGAKGVISDNTVVSVNNVCARALALLTSQSVAMKPLA